VPVRSITIGATSATITWARGSYTFNYADAPSGTDAQKIAFWQDWVQRNVFDERVRINTLAADDPYRLADPAEPWAFWEGQGGNPFLVTRSIVIEDVTYDSNASPPISFTLRKLRP
jgi:hypothetical protein